MVITETEHQPDAGLGFHSHESPNFNLLLTGSHVERFRSGEIHCSPGSLMVKPPGASHANSYGRALARAVIVEFRDPSLAAMRPYSDVFDEITYFQGGIPSAFVWQLFMEGRDKAASWRLRIEELLVLLLSEVSKRKDRPEASCPPWLSRTRDYVESNYRDDLKLADVADVAGVHPVYLTRAFRSRYGCTVAQWIRRKHLDDAIQNLSQTNKSIAQVAAECGFYDQSHLTNALRQTVGLSPTACRRITSH